MSASQQQQQPSPGPSPGPSPTPAPTPAPSSLPKASATPYPAQYTTVWTSPPVLTLAPSPSPVPAASGPSWATVTSSGAMLLVALMVFSVGFNMATRASSGF